ncbi:MAG: hypothetical protein K5756_01410 [Clostridiales bacterium]|nr:hypothetical protein [Clostridiales bacterium]
MNISSIFKKYGRSVSIYDAMGFSAGDFHAFIQPLRYKNKMYLDGVNTQIGFNSQGHYLYIGPPEYDFTGLSGDSWLECGGKKYKIDRAEIVYRGNKKYYVWAIIREIVEES